MTDIRLTRDIALGNGTLKRGRVIATSKMAIASLTRAVMSGVYDDDLLSAIEPSDGVSLAEVLTALANPHLITDGEVAEKSVRTESSETTLPPVIQPAEPTEEWRSLPVERLAIDHRVIGVLRGAGLLTLGQLDAYAEKNKGLTSIKGIVSSTEEQIAEAMRAVLEKD